jgi:F-box/leucine-rich repeat protein 10/11
MGKVEDEDPSDASLHPRILAGLGALADFLVRQLRIMENPNIEDKRRKAIHEKIPSDRIKDPSALARELRWRVKRAAGVDSEDEGDHQNVALSAGKKRKAGRGVTFELEERQPSVVFADTARTRHVEEK